MINPSHRPAVLAQVIPLTPGRRPEPAETAAPAHGAERDAAAAELARALEILCRRGGDRASELPADLGRPALRAQRLLETGPTRANAASEAPGRIINLARRLILAIEALQDLIAEEGAVLAEALQAELDVLTLGELRDLADAILALSTAPTPVPHWATPAAASAADVVLAAAEADLRHAADAHQRLYAHYTDAVWDVAPRLLSAGRHWYRLVARARLRHQLRAVSRTGRLPARLSCAAGDVLDAREARARVNTLAPLLAHHLGRLDRGVFTDVDGARRALAAVQGLQRALGRNLDPARLARLALADAFRSYEVVAPASKLRAALAAWAADAERAGAEALEATLDELRAWAADCEAMLPALAAGATAAQDRDIPLPTLASLVDLLVLRERLEGLRSTLTARDTHAGSAS